jgi:outer membrane lipoprotein-sorting protein
MKKHFIYLFLFLLNASILFAQKKYQAVNDVSLVKKQIKTASAKLKTMQADFVQDKNLTFLDEIIQSKGRFVFRSPNSVRWEYTEPYYYLIIIDNGSITIKDEQKENKLEIASNPIFKQINKLMLSTVKGDILLNKDFDSKVYKNKDTYKLMLVPNDNNMKEFISSIDLILNQKDLTVISIKLIEPMGDYTFITFKNKVLNETLPKNSFMAH